MGLQYSHLTGLQRQELYRLHVAGESQSSISKLLGVHRSTISRELRRNSLGDLGYLPDTAEKKYQDRRHHRGTKIGKSKKLQDLIVGALTMGISPKALAGRLKVETSQQIISHESIYKWIYGAGKGLQLQVYLARYKRKRGLRPCRKASVSNIPNRVSIHDRPARASTKFGHWEGDTLMFSRNKGGIVVLYERQSRLLLASKITSKDAKEVRKVMIKMLEQLPEKSRKSITFDNGGEFACHKDLHFLLKDKTFFCDPYSPWQKGGVENVNAILRRDIPKGSKAQHFSEQDIQDIVMTINNTPRESLNFLTPLEKFGQLLGKKTKIQKIFNNVALQI